MLSRKRTIKGEIKEENASEMYQPAAEEIGTLKNGYKYTNDEVESADLQDPNAVVFNFVDDTNILCGICSQVVPYDTLFSEHMVNYHPDFAEYTVEDVMYDDPATPSLYDQKPLQNSVYDDVEEPIKPTTSKKAPRRVSKIRVNTKTMSLEELESALCKKMVEKLDRKVPVTLVDKQHARCGICNAIVSLNKKFEVVHMVRHFNAWHPAEHKCTGEWLQHLNKIEDQSSNTADEPRFLSDSDFVVVDLTPGTVNDLQCLWCGKIIDVDSIAPHFRTIHPGDVEVPNCRLCLQEIVATARFTQKFEEIVLITLPDEFHFKCDRFDLTTSTEKAMDRAVARGLKNGVPNKQEEDEEEDDEPEAGHNPYANSRVTLGRRGRPKRQFIMPALRQSAPLDSEFVEAVGDCHWTCKLCNAPIYAAVISSGAIKHFRKFHKESLEEMQFEICKARLDYVSDGCMELLDSLSAECSICDITYPLHKPYNMCRAIRHLKQKHPEQMPENCLAPDENDPQDAMDLEDDEL